ncbi:Alpha/Beta hydrolase protein [Gymnopilus junonius]|uniref:Alpha/Beta hydrolase protein n=1 Tax=Gymnopilus junonius TaxID=109634 RepID=A0A9P5TPZ4_GYMJU|nr:Alpha/Beta hydrolase protein [Gymnopilus junonius]
MHFSLPLSFLFLSSTWISIAHSQATSTPFKPWEYKKQTTDCKAVRRAPVEEVVDIQLKYVDINPEAPTTILMVHGWPSLWSTWSNQIQEFKDDYHLVVPDLRGFGESTHPGDTRSSGTMGDMTNDLLCVLQNAKVDSAICMGHDWGSSVCYEAARLRPDVFTAVVDVVVPYLSSAGVYVPIEDLVPHLPGLAYQVYFNSQPEASIAELDKDIRRTIRATLRTVASPPPDAFLKSDESYLTAWDGVGEIPPVPFFTSEEEDYFVQQYSLQGFKHTIQFYSDDNRRMGWTLAHSQGNYTIPQPVLAVYPTEDPVADWLLVAKMMDSAKHIPHLTIETLQGAHWVHLEYPQDFNSIIRRWLERQSQFKSQKQDLRDEL